MIIYGQTKRINRLAERNKQPLHLENDEEFMQLVKEKIATVGDVKAVKYVRMEKGLSLIDAKKYVDSLK
ncbi:hypothetical protein [Oceanobacillus alkalisoli]|uniref:hypothetical protein n=1 Tax=Oceanobacillus alkalisoli TaxID=2925113 RepID=UPI001F11C984|nr:hypothetical protein [Oceanobacillus alkalisoli]MCF3943999.1 hypothetical protein [Oceanobacillus alkalisoli]